MRGDNEVMATRVSLEAARDRIGRLARAAEDDVEFRLRWLEVMAGVVHFEYYAWLLADPEHWTGVRPLARPPDPASVTTLIRWKYLTATNRWTALGAGDRHAASLLQATGGKPEGSELWLRVLRHSGVVDAASVCFADRFGAWGWLDLWRTRGTSFDPAEMGLLAALEPETTTALRRCVALRFGEAHQGGPWAVHPSPAQGVVLLSEELEVTAINVTAERWLELMVPPPNGAVPAEVFNVAAQLQAGETGVDGHAAVARVPIGAGRWAVLKASRMMPSGDGDAGIAVTIERCPSSALLGIYLRCPTPLPRARASWCVCWRRGWTRLRWLAGWASPNIRCRIISSRCSSKPACTPEPNYWRMRSEGSHDSEVPAPGKTPASRDPMRPLGEAVHPLSVPPAATLHTSAILGHARERSGGMDRG